MLFRLIFIRFLLNFSFCLCRLNRLIGAMDFIWFRRIATRYDKLDVSFLAFVYLASIAILLI